MAASGIHVHATFGSGSGLSRACLLCSCACLQLGVTIVYGCCMGLYHHLSHCLQIVSVSNRQLHDCIPSALVLSLCVCVQDQCTRDVAQEQQSHVRLYLRANAGKESCWLCVTIRRCVVCEVSMTGSRTGREI